MPEMSNEDIITYQRYKALGGVDEVSKKIKDLETDNHKQREDIRELTGKQPKADEVIIKKADADLLPKYVELGKPADIKGALDKGTKAAADLELSNTREMARSFAKAAGLAEESVETLIAIPALKGAKFEVKKGKVKDKAGVEQDGEIAFMTLPGDGQSALSLADAAEKVPALKGLRLADAAGTTGMPFVKQGAEGGGSTSTLLEKALQAQKDAAAGGNALRPAKTT